MRRHARKTLAAAVLAVAVALAAGPVLAETIRLVGDTEAVWLIVSADGGYELAAKPIDKPWVTGWGRKTGEISAAAAVRDSLVLFFAGGGHVRYFPYQLAGRPGINPPRELWPAGTMAVAACPAGGSEFDAVLALASNPKTGFLPVKPTAPPATGTTQSTQPTVLPTTPAATTSARAGRGPLALLRYAGQQWRQLAVVPDRFVRPPFRAHLAVREQTVYILLDQKPAPVLIALERGIWLQLDLPAEVADWRPLALLGMPDGIALASFTAGARVGITRSTSGGWTRSETIRRDDQELTWPEDDPPSVARLGKSLALAWREAEQWAFATCGFDGKVSPKREKIFGNGLAPADALSILRHFFTGVLVLLIVLMFWPGQPLRAAPFSLPPTMMPARMDKRTLAFVIDALPFMVFSNVIVDGASQAEISLEKLLAGNITPTMHAYLLYISMTFLASYTVYCILMERRFGATLGKMVMHLRIVADGGRRTLLREVALRNLSKIPELIAILAVIPILFPILTRYRQRLGDKIAWTAVIDAEMSLPPEILGESAKQPDEGADSEDRGEKP